jgi:hypothetical protein
MEAHSMHSNIESAKKHKDVFSLTDWTNIFKSARSKDMYKVGNKKVKKAPYNIKEFKFNKFYDLKLLAEATLKNKTKNWNGYKVLRLKIKNMKSLKSGLRIYFNYDVSEDYLNFDTRASAVTFQSPQTGPRYSTRKGKLRNNRSNPNSVEPPPTPENMAQCHRLQKLYNMTLAISAAKIKDLVSLCHKGVIPEEYQGWTKDGFSHLNVKITLWIEFPMSRRLKPVARRTIS